MSSASSANEGDAMSTSGEALDLKSQVFVEGLAGVGGAIVALLTTYPLLTINTRQQTSVSHGKGLNDVGKGPPEGESETHAKKSTVEEALEIVKTSGVAGLYAGLKPAFIGMSLYRSALFAFLTSFIYKGTIASNAVYFSMCGYLREVYLMYRRTLYTKKSGQKPSKVLNASESLLIAAIAGAVNVLATNPIWIIVTRMQAKRKARVDGEEKVASQSMIQIGRQLYSESGIVGFWKGVLPSLIMVSNPSIQYMFFEVFSRKRSEQKGTALTAFDVFYVSALAKLGATVITYPMLVVKSTSMNTSKAKDEKESLGVSGTIQKIFTEEGLLGFYKGMETKIFQSVFAASVLYMCKEEIKKVSGKVVKNII